jgi:hypothetical protein
MLPDLRFSVVRPVALLLVLGMVAGCAPSLSPLYRDYDVKFAGGDTASVDEHAAAATASVHDRLRAALADAGWTATDSDLPNVLETEPRRINNWMIYRLEVHLEAIPVGDRHVRVLFHPYRRYFTGGRSKVGFMDAGLRQRLLPGLNEALKAHGFEPAGVPRQERLIL